MFFIKGVCMKRYVMEFIGTFFLTTAISLTGHPIAIGFMFMAMIYIGGHVSGGHFNPAVAVGSIICNLLKVGVMADLATVMVYVVGPLAGGVAASFLFNSTKPEA